MAEKKHKKIKHMHIRKADSGHFIAVHSFHPDENGEFPKEEEHVLPGEDSSMIGNHVINNFKDNETDNG